MHLVHTYIAYRVSNICSVYRSGLLMCRIGTVTCVCVTHTNPLTRYLVEGVCTLTKLEITYRVISIFRYISQIFLNYVTVIYNMSIDRADIPPDVVQI